MTADAILERLILHLVDKVLDAGASLTKTKLVKLLYLVDLEYYRVHRNPLTGVRWRYWLYGPYATEIDAVLKKLTGVEIEETTVVTKLGRTAFSYKSADEVGLENLMPFEDRQVVLNVLQRWAEEDLNTILDHVYFETSPMKRAKFGQALDFSSVQPRLYTPRGWTGPVSDGARQRVAEVRANHKEAALNRSREISSAPVVEPRIDRVYLTALGRMNEEESTDLSALIGKPIQITPAARESLREQS